MNFSNLRTLPTQLLLAVALSLHSAPVSWAITPWQTSPPAAFIAATNKQSEAQVPGRRRGGARRGICPDTQVPLTALVPAQTDTTQALPTVYVGGLTVADYPTFWFYVPYPLSSEMSAEFILQDAGTDIYRVSLSEFATTAAAAGFVSVTLPTSLAPLEIDKTYEWYFKVNCTAESPPFVQGGVRRITLDPTLATQLAAASPREQAALYQANDIWYDAIATLGNLRQANPNDRAIAADWQNLLESISINDIPLNGMAP